MNPPRVDDRAGAPLRPALRRHWRLLLAVPATFALAAFFAVSLVPPVYRASVELRGEPGLAERWRADARGDTADEGVGSDGTRPNLSALRQVSDWIEGDATLSPVPAAMDRGIRPMAPDRIVVWAEAGSITAVTAQAESVADLVVRSEAPPPEPVVAAKPAAGAAGLPPAAAAPAGSEDPRASPAWDALNAQAVAARNAAVESRRALDDFLADPANATADDDATLDDRLSVAEARGAQLRADVARLRAAAGEARAGSVRTDAGPAVEAVAGWDDLERLARQRRDFGASVEQLGRTLLDGHPRMATARLRLADLDDSLRTAGAGVGRALDEAADARADRAAASDAEADRLRARQGELAGIALGRAALERQVTLDAKVAGKLEAAVVAAQPTMSTVTPPSSSTPPEPSRTVAPAPETPAAALIRTTLPLETLHPACWPTVAGSALAGLALALLGVAAAGLRRPARLAIGLPEAVGDVPAHRRSAPKPAAETETVAGLEIAAVDDVIDALITSGISRALLMVPTAASARPIGVDIVRRLALRGQSTAIVDLSEDQGAARAMGAGADAPGITDLIEGDATFATIARRDFATRADIVPGGRHPPTSKLDTVAERRNVLDFIERSYETLLIDCGRMSPAGVKALSDTDAALLMAVHGANPESIAAAVRDLHEAGLDDVILVGDTRSSRA